MVDEPRTPVVQGPPGTPRWVKALGVAAILAVLLVVGAMLIMGGQHGPGLHAGSPSGHPGQTITAS